MAKLKDLREIRGQEHVKRGLEVALCGGHSVLLIGPNGAGKTMFAQVFKSISGNAVIIENLPDIKDAKRTLEKIKDNTVIATMVPCPCGNFTDPKRECHCSPYDIRRYLSSVSQKVLDKIDVHLEVPKFSMEVLMNRRAGESTADLVKKIDNFKASSINPEDLDKEADELLKLAILELGISARAYDKIIAVAKTIAKMDGKNVVEACHISEAISYRSLDRNMYG
jgi:magnesium chelatase family protein